MTSIMLLFNLIVSLISCVLSEEFVGCYNDLPVGQSKELFQSHRAVWCASNCKGYYFRYSNFRPDRCICTNYLSEQVSNETCKEHCLNNNCDPSIRLFDTYFTGNLVPGPPRNLKITNITSVSCQISWEEPESYLDIVGYVIKAVILRTFSSCSPQSPEWIYNNTFKADIITLLPSTKYNISVTTKSSIGNGASVYKMIYTKLKEPDSLPVQPTVVKREGTKMRIRLSEFINNNGPVTAYQIIVIGGDEKQALDTTNLFSYKEAKMNNLDYYIAAEITPKEINRDFIVGDGNIFGKYYNAPLNADSNYNIVLGVVSEFNGETKSAYSEPSGTHEGVLILNVDENDDSPAVIIGLSIAIGLLSFMFVAGLFVFVMLKSKIANRRERLSDNHELSLQGPMIEVENNGYIHEEEHISAIGHYRNLKEKVRSIPPNQLKIEPTNLLGIGKFGKVNTGTLHENGNLITVTAYSIHDKKMNQETKKGMLHELDVLIKTGKHDNLLNLIGTSETSQIVVIVMEYTSINLKDLLLGSRDTSSQSFSNMSETQAIEIAIGIAKGMAHLHSCSMIHKQLCARSIMITENFVPKITGYGIAQYFSHNKIPDYTRWTAVEVFKGQEHNVKSDMWSFGCLLWEICALGGTPYGSLTDNNELPEKISKGLRLVQLQYVGDDFYQIMLDCWQESCDERPTFADMPEALENLKIESPLSFLSFSLYPDFQYEQFFPDVELSVRPVF